MAAAAAMTAAGLEAATADSMAGYSAAWPQPAVDHRAAAELPVEPRADFDCHWAASYWHLVAPGLAETFRRPAADPREEAE